LFRVGGHLIELDIGDFDSLFANAPQPFDHAFDGPLTVFSFAVGGEKRLEPSLHVPLHIESQDTQEDVAADPVILHRTNFQRHRLQVEACSAQLRNWGCWGFVLWASLNLSNLRPRRWPMRISVRQERACRGWEIEIWRWSAGCRRGRADGAADGFEQECHGLFFGEVIDGAGMAHRQRLFDHLLMSGKSDDPGLGECGQDTPGGFEAIEAWHSEVHENDIRFQVEGHIHRLDPVGGLPHQIEVWLALEDFAESIPHDLLIINQQHAHAFVFGPGFRRGAESGARFGGGSGSRFRVVGFHWHPDEDSRALARRGIEREVTAEQFEAVSDAVEAEALAVAAEVGGIEAGAFVRDLEVELLVIGVPPRTEFGVKATGVFDDVEEQFARALKEEESFRCILEFGSGVDGQTDAELVLFGHPCAQPFERRAESACLEDGGTQLEGEGAGGDDGFSQELDQPPAGIPGARGVWGLDEEIDMHASSDQDLLQTVMEHLGEPGSFSMLALGEFSRELVELGGAISDTLVQGPVQLLEFEGLAAQIRFGMIMGGEEIAHLELATA
jgi:hypothetical protein